MTILAGTGHRPMRLGLDYSEDDNKFLTDFVTGYLAKLRDTVAIDAVVSGMAAGFDQSLAEAAIALELLVVAVLPFVDADGIGMERHWPQAGKDRFRRILNAVNTITVTPGVVPGRASHNERNLARDRYMVDRAGVVLALWDGKEADAGQKVGGGTAETVGYARGKGVPVVNCYRGWTRYLETHREVCR